MTRLRNEIMKDFDVFEGTKLVPDRSLGREDLEHWIKGGNYLSVTKFQYVDRWVRKKRRDPEISYIFSDLINLKELEHRKVFTELYARETDTYFSIYGRQFPQLEGKLYLSEVIQAPEASSAEIYSRYAALSDYRQIAIYFREVGDRSASISVAYLDTPISSLRPNPATKNWTECYGYLVLVGYDQLKANFSATLHLFRSEFPGYPHSGTSTSMMSLYFADYALMTEWFPQICSQNITGNHKLERPDSFPPRERGDVLEGSCRFEDSASKFPELIEYMSKLTNKYILW